MFGLSFGAKKQKSSSSGTLDKTETQTGTQNQATTGVQAGQTTQTGTSSSTGTAVNTQSSNQQNVQSGSQTGTTKTLSDSVQAGLESAISGLLGSVVGSGGSEAVAKGINTIQDFDADQYVADVMKAATNRGEQQLQETNAAIQSQIGGTAGTNSMAALLAARGSNDLAATLAGVRGEAEANAAKIRQGGLATAASAQGTQTQGLAQIVDALKGGTTTSDQLTQQIAQLLGTQTGTTQTSEQNQTSQQTNTVEWMQQLVDTLLNQTTNTHATETNKSKGTSFGGGLSFGM